MKKLFTFLMLMVCAIGTAWADTYTDEESTVTWAFTSHESLGSTNSPADAFLSTNFTNGSNLNLSSFSTKNCKAGWTEYNLVYIKPTTVVAKDADNAAENMLEWIITPAQGITFTPVSVSITACTAGGTGDPQVTIYAVYSDNTQETVQERTNPRRPDKTDQGDGPSVFTKTLTAAKSGKFIVRAYLAGLTNTAKGEAFTNIVVTGKVSGTPVASATYDLTVSANDSNLGTVTGAGTYAENEEVTLSATAKAGGYFIKWQKDGADFSGNTTASINVTATANASYTAIFGALKSVTFSGLSDYKGTSNTGYSVQYANQSNKWTAPQNYYYASEGKTLTKWSDGTNDYVPGTEYTLTEDIIVTPVFENMGSLNELTEETTVTWPFGTDNGAPTLSSEGNTLYYVQRATIAGNTVDIPIFVNTESNFGITNKKGKFVNNVSNVQVNAGTVFKIPAVKGMVVKYSTNQTSAVENIGFTDDTNNLGGDGSALTNPTEISSDKKTITYTYTGKADYLYLVDINGGKYPTSMSVTYPIRQTKYFTPTITIGDFNFENKSYPVTIAASEGTLQVSTDGNTYTEQTSPYTTYVTTTTTYYAKATGGEYTDSEVASLEVTNTFDSSKSYVAWVYESTYKNAPNNYALANDQIYTTLGSLYNVVAVDVKDYVSAISDEQKTALTSNLKNANLVVISETLTGKSKAAIALEDIVGNVPVLSMKFFVYSSDRWGWGTPKNADKSVVSITPESNAYKVFDGVTYSNDDIALFDYPNDEQNHIQYVDSWASEPTGDVVLAKMGEKPAMHASTTQKYFGLGLSCDDFTKYNANTITIVKNAAAMLIAGDDLTATNPVEVTIGSTGYATFSSKSAVDFSDADVTVYTAKVEGSKAVLSEVESKKVPANTGVILKGSGTVSGAVIAEADALTNNHLIAATSDVTTTGIYILVPDGESVKFTTMTSGTLKAGKAYLPAASSARELNLVFGEATGISEMKNVNTSAEVYNLNGMRIAQPTKGLYIQNGKKLIVK